ncbi:uncharacterized protein [Haliotis cracherodii]|uniref:uncharacterized protein n=1 Tax=Haliotis cracherodii TaxID=6455 RepID=UPI0039EAC400
MDQPAQLHIDDASLDANMDTLFDGFISGALTIVPSSAASDPTDFGDPAAFQAHMTLPPHRRTLPPATGAASQRVAQDSQCGQITSVAPQNVATFGQTCGTVTEQMLINIINVVANPVSSGAAVSSMQPDVAQSDTKDHTNDHTNDNTMSMSLNNSYAAIQNGGSTLPVLSQLTELAQGYDSPVGTNGELMDTGQAGLMSSQGPEALETIQLHDMATIRDPNCAVGERNIDLGTPDASRSMQTRSQTRNRVRRTRSSVSESSMDETSQEFKEYLRTLDSKERKRLLNRLAAKRCRDKKYEKELELEAKARQLREQRSELLRVKAQLQEESKSIATNLRQHAYCLRR